MSVWCRHSRLTPSAQLLAGLTVVLLLGLAAALVAGGGCGKGKGGPKTAAAAAAPETPVSVVVARRGTIREELELTGSCEAYDQIDVVSEVAGKVTRVAVDVGAAVKAGDMLVQLDTALVSKQRVQAERGVDSARAHLNQSVQTAELTDRETVVAIRQAQQGLAGAHEQLRKTQENYRLTAERTDSQIQQARVGVATAQSSERDVMAGTRSQDIARAEASVRQAESDLSLKQTTYNRYNQLYHQGAVAEATLDGYRTQYEVALEALRQAREALSLAREGARQEQKRIAALGVDTAHEQLRQAEAGRRQVEMAARDVDSARVGVRQAEENLKLAYASRRRYNVSVADVNASRAGVGQAVASKDYARTSEGKYTIFAPITGLIAKRDVNLGEGTSVGSAVMRIVNSDPIRVNCRVSELDIAKIKLGDEGETAVDGLPGQTFVGRVADITPQAVKDQRNYIVRVEIDNHEGIIKAGMFARVKLGISEKSDVIVVSRDCLVERGEDRRAYVVENGAVKIRKVKVGVANQGQLEVLSGVNAGELLVSAGQPMLAEGQKVKPVVQQGAAPQQAEAAANDAGPEAGAAAPQPAPSGMPVRPQPSGKPVAGPRPK